MERQSGFTHFVTSASPWQETPGAGGGPPKFACDGYVQHLAAGPHTHFVKGTDAAGVYGFRVRGTAGTAGALHSSTLQPDQEDCTWSTLGGPSDKIGLG
jgi:hypothetical protein